MYHPSLHILSPALLGSGPVAVVGADDSLQAGRWYVVQVQPSSEGVAQANLARQGFHSFLPRFRRTVRHARRQVDKLLPLFPGYLFVRLDLSTDRWRAINGTIGVRSLVMRAAQPACCPGDFVSRLVEASDANGVVDVGPSRPTSGLATSGLRDWLCALDGLDAAARGRLLQTVLSGDTVVS